MPTITVTHGVIKDLLVALPRECSPFTMVEAFAKSFVKHMLEGGLVSDDVLISSIGESHLREAMVGGARERFGDKFAETCGYDSLWQDAVLAARYDEQTAFIKGSIRSGMDEAKAEALWRIVVALREA